MHACIHPQGAELIDYLITWLQQPVVMKFKSSPSFSILSKCTLLCFKLLKINTEKNEVHLS